jgi:dihydrodiol dehydrogenase / D-xylose 1-dehydrogenase (NADP)
MLRWGIIGTGNIASEMAKAILIIEGVEIVAVLSRSVESGNRFAREYFVNQVFTDREAFAVCPDIDVVYIASPHTEHMNDALLCMSNKKAVLCEKPMAVNYSQTLRMVEMARAQHVFLMEAMWSRFFPAIQKAIDLVLEGEIGTLKCIDAKFCFRGSGDTNGRHLDPKLAGGALLDVGIYTLYFATFFCGCMPHVIHSAANIGVTGVDEDSAYLLHYNNGIVAQLQSSVSTETLHDAYLYGTDGYIKIPRFWQADKLVLVKNGIEMEFAFDRFGNGFTYEALHVKECFELNLTESPLLPLNQSLEISALMDKIRSQWPLKYPFE